MNLNNFPLPKNPTTADFSENSVIRKLFSYCNGHWTFRYSIPLLAGSAIFGILFDFTYPVFLALLSIAAFLTIGWVYNFFIIGDNFKKEYVRKLHDILAKQTMWKLVELKRDLLEMKLSHGAKQLDQFRQKFDILVEVLKTKFDEGQLTYSRYYGIAQQVYLSGLDNLSDMILAQKTMKSIDLNYINNRLSELNKENSENMSIKKEIDALSRSIKSYEDQQEKVKKMISDNELALTQMDEATISISEIQRSKDRKSQTDMENSMKALAEMAQRSYLYSR